MSGMASHAWGCACRRHTQRPWNRPEHWRRDEVDYLEYSYGRLTDETIARKLGRSVLGLRLKAKRLRLHKRAVGLSARSVALIFGVDEGLVSKVWIRRGLMRARRSVFRQGPHRVWLVDESEVERFIRAHPEWVDVPKMPPSPFRDQAARDPWISLAEVHRRTGRNHHAVSLLVRGGQIRGRKRGPHWYIPAADVPLIRPLRTPDAIAESVFRRENVLEHRRALRKGIAA